MNVHVLSKRSYLSNLATFRSRMPPKFLQLVGFDHLLNVPAAKDMWYPLALERAILVHSEPLAGL
jgi:hypothetical protein